MKRPKIIAGGKYGCRADLREGLTSNRQSGKTRIVFNQEPVKKLKPKKDVTSKQEKYLEHKLALIRASISGTLLGLQMFGFKGNVHKVKEGLFKQVEKDIKSMARYFIQTEHARIVDGVKKLNRVTLSPNTAMQEELVSKPQVLSIIKQRK